MTQIVHLSDIHVSDSYFLADVAESVMQSVNEISPDIVVITGDLTHNGSQQEFEDVKEYIDRIDCRNKVIVPGNHDSKSFETDDFKIFALHHHLIPVPMTGREVQIPADSGDVLGLLNRCGVNLVLCGHKHVPWVWRLNDMFVVNAGAVSSKDIKARTTHCYNLIDVDREDLRIYQVLPTGERKLIIDSIYESKKE